MTFATYPHVVRRCQPLVAALVTLAAGFSWLQAEQKSADPIVELPKYVVTDSRALPPPESWRYATIPGFEILSNASDRATKRLISDFELFQEALNIVWPMPAQMNTPVLLILCGRGGQFQSFVPDKTEGGPEIARASVYLKGQKRAAIVIDVESTVINIASPDIDDPSSGVDSTRFAIEHNKQLYREYVHYLLSRSETRLPAWFEEGMAQIVMAMKFTPKWIEFGKLDDPNTVSAAAGMAANINAATASLNSMMSSMDSSGSPDTPTPDSLPGAPAEDRDFNAALARRALIPMAEFFAVTHDSPEALNPLGNNTWAKQAYAFVHMGLFGEKGKWKKPFTEFLIRSTREPVTEQMFKECFNMSYRDMGLQLRGYIQWTSYQSQEYHPKKGSGPLLVASNIELRDATESEVGRIKGEAKLLAGHADAARTEFIAPYIRGERDPQLLTVLGLLEHHSGKDDRARKFLTAAVAGKTTDPDAYLQMARFAYADALAAPGAPNGNFSPAQVATITGYLATARTLPPPDPATYDVWAETLLRSANRPQKADLVPLVQGVTMYPGRLKLVYETAALCADAGINDAAHSLVEHGLKYSPDAKTKANFEKLNATLPPLAATTSPATATPASAKN